MAGQRPLSAGFVHGQLTLRVGRRRLILRWVGESGDADQDYPGSRCASSAAYFRWTWFPNVLHYKPCHLSHSQIVPNELPVDLSPHPLGFAASMATSPSSAEGVGPNWSSTSETSNESIEGRLGHQSWSSGVTNSSSISNTSKAVQSPDPAVGSGTDPPTTSSAPASSVTKQSSRAKMAVNQRNPSEYPIVEIERTDQTKHNAMEALQHIQRRRVNQPHFISPSLASPQVSFTSPAQDPSSILAYIQDLEQKVASLQAKDTSGPDQAPDPRSSGYLAVPEDATQSPVRTRTPDTPSTPWIVDIKRFKKLNYRFGSAELYDDSETIEAIRARESAARGGGYVLKVYREYDWEGLLKLTFH